MIDATELENESAELLPGREALGRFSLNLTKLTCVTKHVANVHADNSSYAVNNFSDDAVAQANSGQWISVNQ
ncbi:hypothetical protein [Streptacidiphilus sp. ASG 303]|uniref:hypothetical protein n=1 Tax=Streptomycetaceae TaxID=2062 RepID=UPI001E3F91ED|nr:hypothetical protein [Streptacidiphilus sp. ASG 303]MCD0486209.1 hypothetical protein [Streptacidiphilus sp. ASG 303]